MSTLVDTTSATAQRVAVFNLLNSNSDARRRLDRVGGEQRGCPPMRSVRTRQPVPLALPARVQAGRRVRAARLMAGGISLLDAARLTGMSYTHLVAIERGQHPLTSSDCRDLAALLGVPADWLLRGWLPALLAPHEPRCRQRHRAS